MVHKVPHTPESKLNISKGLAASNKAIGRPKGSPVSEETRQKMREACDGRHMTLFGVHIAENIFLGANPEAIPAGWKDKWDFTLNGERLDIKSSMLSRKTHDWRFNIRKNTECDKFVLMAFNDSKERKLLYTWIIPSSVIGHLTGVVVSEGSKVKWDKYLTYKSE